MFRHPKYYKELRKRNKTDQAISKPDNLEVVDSVRPGPGHKQQAASNKRQASSFKAFEPTRSSSKQQASSPSLKASSVKPQATSCKQREPS